MSASAHRLSLPRISRDSAAQTHSLYNTMLITECDNQICLLSILSDLICVCQCAAQPSLSDGTEQVSQLFVAEGNPLESKGSDGSGRRSGSERRICAPTLIYFPSVGSNPHTCRGGSIS